MTRQEAYAEGEKRWGKRARYLIGKTCSSPERRAGALEQLKPLEAERDALLARAQELKRQIDQLRDEANYFKFALYERLNPARGLSFFPVDMERGKGDTWEEAFADANRWTKPATTEEQQQTGGAR